MIHQGLQNKDILSYIFQFFDKTEDKQTIFNLASCNKRINTILENPIGSTYAYIVHEGNVKKIPTRYKALRIILPTIDSKSITYDHDKIIPMMETINNQIKLNTLELLNIQDVFNYTTKNVNFFRLTHRYAFCVTIIHSLIP